MSVACIRSSCFPDTTVSEIGTSWGRSGRRCAVTMISSPISSPVGACAAEGCSMNRRPPHATAWRTHFFDLRQGPDLDDWLRVHANDQPSADVSPSEPLSPAYMSAEFTATRRRHAISSSQLRPALAVAGKRQLGARIRRCCSGRPSLQCLTELSPKDIPPPGGRLFRRYDHKHAHSNVRQVEGLISGTWNRTQLILAGERTKSVVLPRRLSSRRRAGLTWTWRRVMKILRVQFALTIASCLPVDGIRRSQPPSLPRPASGQAFGCSVQAKSELLERCRRDLIQMPFIAELLAFP